MRHRAYGRWLYTQFLWAFTILKLHLGVNLKISAENLASHRFSRIDADRRNLWGFQFDTRYAIVVVYKVQTLACLHRNEADVHS